MRLLIFKHLHRIVGATEIAESDSLLRDNFGTFLKFERSTCNTRVIFPWLPTPLYFVRLFSAIKLYMRILNIVNQRNKEQRREEDGLAVLMDKCETPRQAAEVSGPPYCFLLRNDSDIAWYAVCLHGPRSECGHYFKHNAVAAHLPGTLA